NVPFTELTEATQKLRPITELSALFAKAGVQPGDTVVTYCHIGQQASAVLFAARTLGFPVLIYDGSFEDWSRHPGFPGQTGGPGPLSNQLLSPANCLSASAALADSGDGIAAEVISVVSCS